MIKAGDIGFSGKRAPSFYSTIVMWATKSRWSHCFTIIGECLGEMSVMESHLDIAIVPFWNEYHIKDNDYFEIFRPTKATPENIKNAGLYCFANFAAEEYGFLQPVWYLIQALLKRVGIKIKRNWFRSGLVCSGLVYEYVKRLGPEYAEMLEEFDCYNVTPQDIFEKAKDRHDLFVFIGGRT